MLVDHVTDPAFPLRYGAVAGFCMLTHNAILIGAVWTGVGVLGAAVLSFCIMVCAGYLLLCAFAFRVSPTLYSFKRYFTAMALNFPLTTGMLWLFTVLMRLPVAAVAPAVTVLMVGINFLWARWAIGRSVRCVS